MDFSIAINRLHLLFQNEKVKLLKERQNKNKMSASFNTHSSLKVKIF